MTKHKRKNEFDKRKRGNEPIVPSGVGLEN